MAAMLTWILALTTAILHNSALLLTGLDPVTTPVSALSRSHYGNVNTLGIVLFALAHCTLAAALPGAGRGTLWQLGRLTLLLAAAATLWVAWHLATPSAGGQALAAVPLWLQASLAGLSMALLWPGLRRLNVALCGFNASVLIIWLLLIPLGLLAGDAWTGGYERLVGIVYVLWMLVMGAGLMLIGQPPPPRAAARRAAHD